ncbi:MULTISPECIES: hypothetical protein [Flavobacterium]|uniref:Apea-like HEPN domain-containing protein n=1 Tax=Flavobacterium jumunjinense TaxID=998845 RepID=A0ABV5GS47_9FLAO|nr:MULTISPECIES: hypothetical protein [Flavobacterium]
MNNKYSPFWILNPLSNQINVRNYKKWRFYSSKEVIDGLSPLNELGKTFYEISHQKASLYDHCIWIFNDSEYDFNNSVKLTDILESIVETFTCSFLSQCGSIIKHKNGSITKQPANPKVIDSAKIEYLTLEKLKRIIDITEVIYENNHNDYLEIFKYLRDIKMSKPFIGQLALWSFLEHHWASKKEYSKLDSSLSKMLNIIYEGKELKHEKKKIRTAIQDVGKSLGKEYDEIHLRNILAHGKHYTLKEKWTDLEWNNFFKIHDELFELVIKGIEKEILSK